MKPACGDSERHSFHSYFNTSPESPDGPWLLFFSSTTPEAHQGEVRIRERAAGKEHVLASGVTTEDTHRVGCQQWCQAVNASSFMISVKAASKSSE